MNRSCLLAVVLLSVVSARAVERIPHRETREVADSPFSVDFEMFLTDPLNSSLTDAAVQTLSRSGVKWARVMVNWDTIERATGVYSFAGVDNLMNRLRPRGYHVFMTLNGGSHGGQGGSNPLYAGGNSPTAGNGGLTPWLRFVDAAVERYQGSVSHWEIWNEPNFDWQPSPNAADFAPLAAATIQRIRARQPGAYLILGGTTHVDMKFLETVLPVAGSGLDAVGIHPYRQYPEQSQDAFLVAYPSLKPNPAFMPVGASTYGGEIAKIRELLASLGLARLKIWSTEAGNSSLNEASGLFPGTETRQAKSLSRYYLLNLSLGIERSSWFRSIDYNLVTNLFTPTGQPWVETYSDPSFLARGLFASFGLMTLTPTSSTVIPATATTSSLNIGVAGSAISASNANNFAEYSITAPAPADYTLWFRLRGPNPSTYGLLYSAVNGSSGTYTGPQYAYGAFNQTSALVQGQNDFSQYYYSPMIHIPLQPNQELPYYPVYFSLAGTFTLRLELHVGSLEEIRLVRIGDLAPKKSFTALRSLAALFDGRTGLSEGYKPAFTNVNLSTGEWANLHSAAFVRGGKTPLIAYWIGTVPGDSFPSRSLRISLPTGLADPVLIDPLEDTVQALGNTSREFTLPATDYPLILTSRASLAKALSSLLPREEVFNYPNPVRGDSTTLRFYLTQAAPVTLRLYNAAREEVHSAALAGAAGRNAYEWHLGEVANGIYFGQIEAGGEKAQLKIIVLR